MTTKAKSATPVTKANLLKPQKEILAMTDDQLRQYRNLMTSIRYSKEGDASTGDVKKARTCFHTANREWKKRGLK